MNNSMRVFAIALIMFMLVYATGMVAEAKTKLCDAAQSNKYKGQCHGKNCSSTCKSETYTGPGKNNGTNYADGKWSAKAFSLYVYMSDSLLIE
ncbi:hypothetical protein CASFOL_020709 [Castilleja foliolosa]|uniref:Uncharacterized protein n=1 Tax=Castilleja foliolosa TaxID=1961234 RepID=A0ABD3D2F3_9LAMI